MSKIIDAIRVELLTGRKVDTAFVPVVTTAEFNDAQRHITALVEYRISSTWVQTGHCRPDEFNPLVEILQEGSGKLSIARLKELFCAWSGPLTSEIWTRFCLQLEI